MNSTSIVLQQAWSACSWTLLSCAGIVGLVALISPQTFQSLSKRGGRWLDSEKMLARLDKRIDVDQAILPHSLVLGAAVVATVAIVCARFTVF